MHCGKSCACAIAFIVFIKMAAFSSDRDIVGDELNLLSDFEEELVLEPGEWEIGDQSKLCVCEIPSTQNLIRCSKEECAVKWFHRECVGVELPPSSVAQQQASSSASPAAAARVEVTTAVGAAGKGESAGSWICKGRPIFIRNFTCLMNENHEEK